MRPNIVRLRRCQSWITLLTTCQSGRQVHAVCSSLAALGVIRTDTRPYSHPKKRMLLSCRTFTCLVATLVH